jgi:aspartate oxidase
VLRSEAELETLLTNLARLAAPATALPEAAAIDDGGVRAGVEATNLHAVSTVIATAARNRTESRGCHRRADFPGRRPGWHRHQFLQLIDGDLQTVGIDSTVAA